MNKSLKLLLGVVISSVCLYYTFRNFKLSDLSNSLSEAHWAWFLPSLLIHPIAYIFRSIRWRILLLPLQRLDMKTVFMVLTFGFFVNNVLPFRLGELARAYAINRSSNIPSSSALGTIAVERAMDLFGLLFTIFLALTVVSRDKVPLEKIILLFVSIGAFIVIMFFLLETRGELIRKRMPQVLIKPFELLQNIVKGFSSIKSKSKLFLTLLLSIAIWSTEILNIFCLSRVFDLDLSIFQAAVVIVGISVGVMIPAAPGFVGTYEFFGSRALVDFMGFPVAISTSFIIVVHFFQILYNSVLGIPGLFKYGLGTKPKV